MIKLYLDVNDAVHANEHTKHSNHGLHVNIRDFLLLIFCFMMKKNHFKQKLLLSNQVPFKKRLFKYNSCLVVLNLSFTFLYYFPKLKANITKTRQDKLISEST